MIVSRSVGVALALLAMPAFAQVSGSDARASSAAPPTLDFDFFKARIEPIFTTKRGSNARCISCHGSGTPLRLQPLAPGATTWTDDESRKNFQAVQRVAFAGSVKSRLLVHPLEESAGGDFYHSGGKHWTSQDDPEWQVLKAWVLGQTK